MTNQVGFYPFSAPPLTPATRENACGGSPAMTDGAPVYPVGLVVRGRPCLVVGGGRVAARKIASLLQCGAAVTVVAPEVHVAIGALADSGALGAIDDTPLDVQIRRYVPGEAARYALVVAATGDGAVDDTVHRDASAAGVWVNVADDASRCSFLLPAVARDGPVTVAVSTGGASPALASWLRDRVADALGPGVGVLAALLQTARRRVQDAGRSTETLDWRALLDGPLPQLVPRGAHGGGAPDPRRLPRCRRTEHVAGSAIPADGATRRGRLAGPGRPGRDRRPSAILWPVGLTDTVPAAHTKSACRRRRRARQIQRRPRPRAPAPVAAPSPMTTR